MTVRLRLTEPTATSDLDTFLGRAAAVQDGSVRVIVTGGVLAVYAPVLQPASLLDDAATVLGLRVFAVDDDAEELDRVVSIQSLRSRVTAADAAAGFEIGLPTPVYAVTWAGVVPPRGGWAATGEVSSAILATTAVAGIAEVAEAIPANAGDPVVRSVRGLVWNAPILGAESLPKGAALAAYTLGFLPPSGEERATIYEVGPWARLSLTRGHVLVKRRAWSFAG